MRTAVAVVVPVVVLIVVVVGVVVVQTAPVVVVVMMTVGSGWMTKVLSICRLHGPRAEDSIDRTLCNMFHPSDVTKKIVLHPHG